MSSMGYIQGLGGKGGYPPNWSELGYSDTPDSVVDSFNYAKEIAANWATGGHENQFYNDKRLAFFPSGLDLMGTSNYANMFRASNLMYIPPITLGFTSGAYGNTTCAGMFRETGIKEVTILGVKNPAGTDDTHYYNDCFNLCTNLRVANINSKPRLGVPYMFYYCKKLTTVTGLDLSSTQTLNNMHGYNTSLVTAPSYNTSSATNMNSMFEYCTSLTTVPLYDVSHVTTATYMFNGCTSLASIPQFNFSSLTSGSNMFQNCSSLVTAPQLTLSSLTTATSMFQGCTALENFPVLNIPSARNMNGMFNGCRNLTDTSRDNILQTFLTPTNYTSPKTLQALGFSNSMYSAASWQALPHYSDFTTAGWTIGYS